MLIFFLASSVVSKKRYTRTIYEPFYKRTIVKGADRSNYDFAREVDEILTEAIEDLTGSEKFKQLIK